MNNFTFQNPVKLIFGKGSIAKLAKEIPADKKINLTGFWKVKLFILIRI